MGDDRIAAHPISLRRDDPGVGIAFGIGLTQCPDLANALTRHYRVNGVGDNLPLGRNGVRSSRPPRHRSLQLVCLHSEVNRVSYELEILAQGVAFGSCHDALDLPVA